MENVGDDADNDFHEDLKFARVTLFKVTQFVSLLENAPKVSSFIDAHNDLQEDLKIFKSDKLENYKSFVPAEVQNHYYHIILTIL